MIALSEPQQQAVEYIGTPTLVVAGAGAGKTRTLTAKIAHLVEKGYNPKRILAITFTNKAAEEMKTRLTDLTGLSIDRFPWVRTYHSACLRILKAHGHLLGYEYPIQICADYQQQKILTDIIVGRLKSDKKSVRPVQSHISNAKNSGDPAEYFRARPKVKRIPLAEVFDLYERELRAKNAVDFDNILLKTRDLLRDHKEVREQYRRMFQYILCDEYQDTNNINEEITRLLITDGNLFVTGDDWQSIYSFRMSNVDHFLSFGEKYRDARIFRLEQNYRSANEIVHAANELIDFNRRKMEKKCFSEIRGGVIELHDFFTDEEESEWVSRKIRIFREMGIPLDRMAVLYRTKFSSLAFEQVFRRNGIPYRMVGGKGFFERREIMDLNCYLAAAVFPKDDASFDRIINTPKRGIGPGTVQKINLLRTEGMGLQDAARKALGEKILTPKVYASLKSVLDLLDAVRDMPPRPALTEIIEQTGYRAYMKKYSAGESDFISREENVEQLLHTAGRMESLIDYLEEAALIREDHKDEEDDGAGCVNLSTVHAAKGLEYHVVFVAACEEGVFPHWRSSDSASGLEEERRLMYVSMTRSEKYLYLTSADYRKGQYNSKSRFIEEIREGISD